MDEGMSQFIKSHLWRYWCKVLLFFSPWRQGMFQSLSLFEIRWELNNLKGEPGGEFARLHVWVYVHVQMPVFAHTWGDTACKCMICIKSRNACIHMYPFVLQRLQLYVWHDVCGSVCAGMCRSCQAYKYGVGHMNPRHVCLHAPLWVCVGGGGEFSACDLANTVHPRWGKTIKQCPEISTWRSALAHCALFPCTRLKL